MKLEDIGFYTLCDERAENVSATSPMWRCEMIVTDRCNFRCPYCRGLKPEYRGDIDYEVAVKTLLLWIRDGLKHVRFSGGEPLLYKHLYDLIVLCKAGGVERIAISTNGSAIPSAYMKLIEAGVNDISISLDACCSSDGEKMSGGVKRWDTVVDNIRILSKVTYVTVGIVLTDDNIEHATEIIQLAHGLGVADIRVIPAAQKSDSLGNSLNAAVDVGLLFKHPILAYRVKNTVQGKAVRGLGYNDSPRCYLVMDDSCVVAGYHFPCVIYMRERGEPIGKVGDGMRASRLGWSLDHQIQDDPICKANCLDVCVAYNNKANSVIL